MFETTEILSIEIILKIPWNYSVSRIYIEL